MAARSRGLGISSKDMEASRLVFVFVRDSKPRRKVAIPVLDNYTWEQFLDQVKTKLKLTGIADIYFSANGHKVRSVSELQDIDELCVVEGPDAITANGGSASAFSAAAAQRGSAELPIMMESAAHEAALPMASPSMRQQSNAQERHKVVVSADGMLPSTSASYAADDEAHKYARRAHPLKRTLQRLFPNLFAPGLPVTARDAQDSGDGSRPGGSRRRRVRRSPYDLRNLLLVLATMSCVFTMLYLFIRVSSSTAMGGMPQPAAAPMAAGGVGGAAGSGVHAPGVAGGGQVPAAGGGEAVPGGAGTAPVGVAGGGVGGGGGDVAAPGAPRP